jgi:hypothetical protein
MSFDDWKTTDPADRTLGRANGQPQPFCCHECAWRGKGYFDRSEHFRETGHETGIDVERQERRRIRRTA